MPARDILHDIVKEALIKDGWIITHDPLTIYYGIRKVYVDLGAEKLLGAEKAGQQIAVEIKSFVGRSAITDLERALGQYVLYGIWLQQNDARRVLYIALDTEAYDELFRDISGQVLLEQRQLRLIVVDTEHQEIVRWIN